MCYSLGYYRGGINTVLLGRLYLSWALHTSGVEAENAKIQVVYRGDVPQQVNGIDCGIYALLFSFHEAFGHRMVFGPEHIPFFRRLLAQILIQGLSSICYSCTTVLPDFSLHVVGIQVSIDGDASGRSGEPGDEYSLQSVVRPVDDVSGDGHSPSPKRIRQIEPQENLVLCLPARLSTVDSIIPGHNSAADREMPLASIYSAPRFEPLSIHLDVSLSANDENAAGRGRIFL